MGKSKRPPLAAQVYSSDEDDEEQLYSNSEDDAGEDYNYAQSDASEGSGVPPSLHKAPQPRPSPRHQAAMDPYHVHSATYRRGKGPCHDCGRMPAQEARTIDRRQRDQPPSSRARNRSLSPAARKPSHRSMPHPAFMPEKQHRDTPPKNARPPIPKGEVLVIEPESEVFRLPVFSWIESGLRKMMWHFAHAVTRVPLLFLALPLIIAVLSMVSFILKKEALQVSVPFDTYYRQGSKPSRGMNYNSTNPRFDSIALTSPADFAVLVRSNEKNKRDTLTKRFMEDYLELKHKIEDIGIQRGDEFYWYTTLCRYSLQFCERNPVRSIVSEWDDVELTYPEIYGKDNTSLYIANTFGGVSFGPLGELSSAASLLLPFSLKDDSRGSALSQGSIVGEWEERFREVLTKEGSAMQLNWWSYRAFVEQVSLLFNSIHRNLSISVGILVFLCALFGFTTSSVTSRPWLGLAAGVSITLVVICGVSLQLGIHNTIFSAAFPLFYVFAGVQALFLFEYMQAWRKYNNDIMSASEKFKVIIATESPLLIWFCLSAALGLGLLHFTSHIPILHFLSREAMLTLGLMLVFTLTFYACIFYQTGKRESSNLPWFACWKTGDKDCTGSTMRRYNHGNVRNVQRKVFRRCDECFASRIGAIVSSPVVRAFSLMAFCVYVVFASWGCKNAGVRMGHADFLSGDSQLSAFLRNYEREFNGSDYVEIRIDGTFEYHTKEARQSLFALADWAEQQGYTEKAINWLRDFDQFQTESEFYVGDETFASIVRLAFLDDKRYRSYESDIVLAPNSERIVESRIYLPLTDKGKESLVHLVQHLRNEAKRTGLNGLVVLSESSFLLEHDIQIIEAALISIGTLILAVSFMSLLGFAQPLISIIVLLSMGSVACGTFGLGTFIGIRLHIQHLITVICGLVYTAAVTLSVCFHFVNNGLSTEKARMEYAFSSAFYPAVKSTTIIICTALPLLATPTQLTYETLIILGIQSALSLLHPFLFLSPILLLLNAGRSKCCRSLWCSCCCCKHDDFSSSIYYIPTTAKPVDTGTVRSFYKDKFREDILKAEMGENVSMPPRGVPTGMAYPIPMDARNKQEDDIPLKHQKPEQMSPEKTRRHSAQESRPSPQMVHQRNFDAQSPPIPRRRKSELAGGADRKPQPQVEEPPTPSRRARASKTDKSKISLSSKAGSSKSVETALPIAEPVETDSDGSESVYVVDGDGQYKHLTKKGEKKKKKHQKVAPKRPERRSRSASRAAMQPYTHQQMSRPVSNSRMDDRMTYARYAGMNGGVDPYAGYGYGPHVMSIPVAHEWDQRGMGRSRSYMGEFVTQPQMAYNGYVPSRRSRMMPQEAAAYGPPSSYRMRRNMWDVPPY